MKVFLGGMLRELAGRSEIEIELKKPVSLNEFFSDYLFARYPSLALRVADEQMKIRPHVAVFIGDKHIRFLENEKSVIAPGDQISILPAVSGG
jgi:molybdopterin converting factor small subunit